MITIYKIFRQNNNPKNWKVSKSLRKENKSPTSSPDTNNEIFCVSLLKSILLFLTNQAVRCNSCGICHSYFPRNLFLIPFMAWIQYSIQQPPWTFSGSLFFFNWKLSNQSYFLDLDRGILNLIYLKIRRYNQNLVPWTNLKSWFKIYQPIIQFGLAKITWKSTTNMLSRRC